MRDARLQLITAIHDTPTRAVIVTSGAGSQALADLLAVGGASRTLIEGVIPYSTAAFVDFLARTPEQFVAAETARWLAGRAYTRARYLEPAAPDLVGVACTASIASDRPKRGDHRAQLAVWRPTGVVTYSLTLAKGGRDRLGEEALVSHLLIVALAITSGAAQTLDLALGAGDALTTASVDFASLAEAVVAGERPWLGWHDHGLPFTAHERPRLVLSGSFNPLHAGHLGMAQAAEQLLGQPVAFELAAHNVDKPPLPAATVLARLAQFAGRYAVLVSTAPTYAAKSRLYPGATFVIGYDTAVRVFDPRYYNHSVAELEAALNTIRAHGCTFLVAGRVDQAGVFRTLADLPLPPAYADLFQPIPADVFRQDISSTQLRAADGRASR